MSTLRVNAIADKAESVFHANVWRGCFWDRRPQRRIKLSLSTKILEGIEIAKVA